MGRDNIIPGLLSDGAVLFSRDQYHLGRLFDMPDDSGPKRAIAIAKSAEITLISLYTVLVTGSFMAFWILLSMGLPYCIPRRYRREKAIRKICAWEMSEPLQASWIMGKYCWRKIQTLIRRQKPNVFPLEKGNISADSNPSIRTQQSTHGDDSGHHDIAPSDPGCVHNGTISHPQIPLDENSKPPAATLSDSVIAVDEIPSPTLQISKLNHAQDLFFGMVIFLLASGCVVGGVIAGIFLPETLVIGHVAPVNEQKVFLWNCFQLAIQELVYLNMRIGFLATRRVARAVGAVDSAALNLEEIVHVRQFNFHTMSSGEESYEIEYNYTVTGVDMGLQKLGALAFHVEGNCTFEYDWYQGTEIMFSEEHHAPVMYDKYFPWGDESEVKLVDLNSTCGSKNRFYDQRLERESNPPFSARRPDGHFYLNPYAQAKASLSSSLDPWYLTGSVLKNGHGGESWECDFLRHAQFLKTNPFGIYRVQPGRPLLHCQNRLSASYSNGPRVKMPPIGDFPYGLQVPDWERYHQWVKQLKELLPDANVSEGVTLILGVNIGLWMNPHAFNIAGLLLHPSASTGDTPIVLDAGRSSAFNDIKRIVSTAYISLRNLCRDAALEFFDPMLPPEVITNPELYLNVLVHNETHKPVSGVGDFVVPSTEVTTLRLGTLVAIPTVLFVSWLIVFICWLARKSKHGHTGGNSLCNHSSPGCLQKASRPVIKDVITSTRHSRYLFKRKTLERTISIDSLCMVEDCSI